MSDVAISGYRYSRAGLNHSHGCLLPAVLRLLDGLKLPEGERRLFELGCGNGSVANELAGRGWDVTGVDPSAEGIRQARAAYPGLKLASGSAYDDLAAQYGQLPVLLSLEVVEHVYDPRHYARTAYSLLSGGDGDPLHALSRLLEEPGAGGERAHGSALYGAVGSRAYQVLVDGDAG